MKQLILTKIDPVEKGRRVEHLGPWSLSDEQFFEWEWEKYGIRRALRSEDIWPVSRSLEKVCEFYALQLSRRQNERHNRSYSDRYWRILLMPWLFRLIMRSFDLFLRIRNRVSSGVPYLAYLSPRGEAFSPVTTPHFNRMMADDPLNRLILSRFLRAYAPQGWEMRDGDPAPPDKYFSADDQKSRFVRDGHANHARFRKSQRKMEIYHWASILFSNPGCVQFQRVSGLGPLDGLYLSLRLLLRSRRRWRDAAGAFQKARRSENENLTKDEAIEEIKSIHGVDARGAGIFLRVLEVLIEETMPKAFTDGFRENERRARRKIKATAPWTDALVSGLLTGEYDPWRFYAAGLLESRPVGMLGSQHGGMVGLVEAVPFYNLVEYETADRFVSWGWERQSDYEASAVPVASPLLSKMRRGKKRNSSIIMISSTLPVYSKWVQTDYMPEDISRYMKEKIRFIEHLKDGPRAALWYRPHIHQTSERYDRAYMEKRYPEMKILSGKLVSHILGRLGAALSQCGACVLDAPGSVPLFAMAARIPTVFFWNENVWRISRHAKSDVEKLAGVNVLHSSPESAARHLNAIWPDVDSWWEDSRTREAVDEFAHHYCRSSRNWRSEWVDLFSSADSGLWKTELEDKAPTDACAPMMDEKPMKGSGVNKSYVQR